MKKLGKALILLLLVAAMGYVALGGMLFMLNTGAVHFTALLVAIFVSLIILFVYLNESGNGKKTAIWISILLAIGLAFAAPQLYKDSFAKVDDAEVDLYAYEPFQDNEKVAELEGPATFQIEGDLPILDGATALYPLFAAFAQSHLS